MAGCFDLLATMVVPGGGIWIISATFLVHGWGIEVPDLMFKSCVHAGFVSVVLLHNFVCAFWISKPDPGQDSETQMCSNFVCEDGLK
jgi:hypothetical protein